MTCQVFDLDEERSKRIFQQLADVRIRVLMLTSVDDHLAGAGWVDDGEDDDPRALTSAEARTVADLLLRWADAEDGQ